MGNKRSAPLSKQLVVVLPRPDISMQDSDGRTVAIVEVKNQKNLSRDIAMELSLYWAAYVSSHHIPYLLLLSQDRAFLWENVRHRTLKAVPPTYEFPMEEIVSRYMPGLAPMERLRETELNHLVFQWLLELSAIPREPTGEAEETLARSGFLDMIRGGTVKLEAAA